MAFLPSAQAPADGRRFVRDRLGSWGLEGDLRDTAVLLASELLTNAVVHGRSEVRLDVEVDAGTLRVSVGDQDSRRPTLQPFDDDALGGRGLAIVDMLADDWGVDEFGLGKIVWFQLRLPSPTVAANGRLRNLRPARRPAPSGVAPPEPHGTGGRGQGSSTDGERLLVSA